MFGKILSFYRVRKLLLYIFCVTITAVNYEVFLIYANEELYEILPFFEGFVEFLTLFACTLLLILYNTRLAHIHNKYFCCIAIIFRMCAHLLMSAQIRLFDYTTHEGNKAMAKTYFALNGFFFLSTVRAFLTTPALMAFAKCTPHSVEGMMLGLAGSIIKLNTEIIARLISLLFLINTEITIHSYEGLSDKMSMSAGFY